MVTKMRKKAMAKKKSSRHAEGSSKATRRVPGASKCPFCKRAFWAPKGAIVCPRCGKRIEVQPGVEDSMAGFFTKHLEGIALSGGISGIDVAYSYPCSHLPRSSQGLVDEGRKTAFQKPHQKRAIEGQNMLFKVISGPGIASGAERGEMV
jgi:DNA-directed RNA polymerase subunit RPC12/RpoP